MSDNIQKSVARQQKINLPEVEPAWVVLQNALLAKKISFDLDIGNEQWLCNAADYFVLPRAWQCVLQIGVGGHICQCYLENLAPFATAELDANKFAFLPSELVEIVVESKVMQFLEKLTNSLGYNCELLSFQVSTSQDESSISLAEDAIGIRVNLSPYNEHLAKNSTHVFITDISSELMKIILHKIAVYVQEFLQDEDDFTLDQNLARAKIALGVVWQSNELDLQDIEALSTGDILLMPSVNVPVSLRQGNNFAKAMLNFNTNELTLESYMLDDILENGTPLEVEGGVRDENNNEIYDKAVDPKHCPIALNCHLGNVSLSLEDLTKLSPGMILGPLESLDAPVTICIGHTKIGKGSLVEIEGRIGVQVTETFYKKK